MAKDTPSFFLATMQGFLASSAAIGLIRARLSFQVQISSAFDTGLVSFPLVHIFAIIAFMLLFSFIPTKTLLARNRAMLTAVLSIGVSILYGGCLIIPDNIPLVLSGIIASDLFTAFSVRLWGEDNAASSVERIVLRLGASLVVQYVAYSAMLAIPSPLRGFVTVLLPVLIGALLLRPPRPLLETEPDARLSAASSGKTSALLLVTVGFSCIAHGILFCLPGSNSSTWILGPLAIAALVFACASRAKGVDLFRLTVCITLGVQCLCAIPLFVFHYNEDVISFLRALSYSATMLLTMTVGCWDGSRRAIEPGRALCRWLLLYFVAFYAIYHSLEAVGLDESVLTALMLFCLVLSALPMAASSWKNPSDRSPVADRPEERAEAYRKLTSPSWGLTPRESEVLVLIAAGYSAGEAAAKLQVSKNTIRSQIRSIYQKLGVHTREELQAKLLETSD